MVVNYFPVSTHLIKGCTKSQIISNKIKGLISIAEGESRKIRNGLIHLRIGLRNGL